MGEEVKVIGIKELSEALDAVHVLAVGGAAIAHNGLGLDDIPEAVEILKKYSVVAEGIKDVEGALPEIKDVDAGEAAILFAKIVKLIGDVKKAHAGEAVEL